MDPSITSSFSSVNGADVTSGKMTRGNTRIKWTDRHRAGFNLSPSINCSIVLDGVRKTGRNIVARILIFGEGLSDFKARKFYTRGNSSRDVRSLRKEKQKGGIVYPFILDTKLEILYLFVYLYSEVRI